MKTRYFRKGQLVWKFSDDGAFVRIIDSAQGWAPSVMMIEDMPGSNAKEISEAEAEI